MNNISLRPSVLFRKRAPKHLLAFAALAWAMSWSSPAAAQISRVGNSIGVADVFVFGSEACYDSVHQVYLVVGGQGPIWGVFVNTAGSPLGGAFRIGSSNQSKPFGLFPRCAFSADANGGQGGFLVAWHQDDSVNFVHSLMVTYPGGVVSGSERTLSDGSQGGSNFRFGVSIAYSVTSKKFLVAFGTLVWNVQGRFLDLTGSPTTNIFTLAAAPSGGGVQEPSLTWHATTDEFGLAYSGFDNSGAFVSFRRIAASTGNVSASPRFGQGIGTFCTGVIYNPNTGNYVMGWSSQGVGAVSAEIDNQGNVLKTSLLSQRLGTPTSFSMAFNPISGTSLAVSEDPNSTDVVGLEVNKTGAPNTTAAVLTNGGGTSGSFFPRVGARTDAKEWNITFARRFTSIAVQIISTTSSEAAPVSNVQMNIDAPGANSIFRSTDTITMQGWAVDRAAASGTGIDAIHLYAFPQGSSQGTFLAAITSFSNRGDVGGLLGPQFTNSGWSATINLPVGNYTINAYPHSTVTGGFGNPKALNISVANSLPLMSVDTPTNNSAVPNSFTMSGWALDRFAGSGQGTGVVTIHVWAFPASGPPVFFAQANMGGPRGDVGAFFGSQFDNSGFSATGTLPAGSYQLVAYLYSGVSNTWALSQGVNITVTGPKSAPVASLDSPGAGNVQLNAIIGGWAIDTGAPSGTGVDTVHVWAFNVNGGATFVGAAGLGFSRGDVGGIYGSQFTPSGFNLLLNAPGLQQGQTYDLAVYARSSVSGNFNMVKVVRITIQ